MPHGPDLSEPTDGAGPAGPRRGPTLVLLHGLGGTPGVWHDVRQRLRWEGRVVAPPLAGHGTAPWTGDYTLGGLASGVAATLEQDEPAIVLGHSLGGAIGMVLASGWFRPAVLGVVGIGVKVAWADGDVARMAKVAGRGVRWFDTREEAVDRFLLQSGLTGVAGHDHPAALDAVVEEGGRWRVAQDPATLAQRAVDTAQLLRTATCPVLLGAGDDDAVCTAADLARYVDDAPRAPGRGHNVQVEDPDWVLGLLDRVAAHPGVVAGP